jgi:cobalt/nickel transport protein
MQTKLTPWITLLLIWLPGLATAHFQTLIPSLDIIAEKSEHQIILDLSFTHPMQQGPVMAMGNPIRFGVIGPNGQEDLREHLISIQRQGKQAYQSNYRFTRPGDYCFYIEPAPYWEPSEGVMIKHYTKVVVGAFAGTKGWDQLAGFPVEIDPLVRPYGLWTGNLFQGVVKQSGKPVPFAEIEVEWLNDGTIIPPSDPYITQIIKADANGTFSYALPRAGWWGFAALIKGDETLINPQGEVVPLEQGALIWIYARDMTPERR